MRSLRLILYVLALLAPAVASDLPVIHPPGTYDLKGSHYREMWNAQDISALILAAFAAIAGATWLIDLIRGHTFWIPVSRHALIILICAVMPCIVLLAVGDVGRLRGIVSCIMTILAAIMLVVMLGADFFGKCAKRPNVQIAAVLLFLFSIVWIYTTAGKTGMLALMCASGLYMAYVLLPAWWGKFPVREDLVHTNLDFWFGRAGILSEGTKQIKAIGLHGLSRARERRTKLS